jgi:cyclomaltodextrinase / maltogenic alpha-amylase / neopullulanase
MADQSLNRREFLRLSYALAGGALLTACQKEQFTPTLVPTLTTMAGIQLDGSNADAWTFNKLVTGDLKNPDVCDAVWIQNNESRLPALLKEKSFSVNVPIQPGANHLNAVCQHFDQEEELSSENTIMGRLNQRPTARIALSLVQDILILEGGSSQPDELEKRPIRDFIWSARADNPAFAQVQVSADQEPQDFRKEVNGSRIEVILPPVDGEFTFSLRVIDEAGRADTSSTYVVVENGRPRIPDYDHENPAWVEEAIVYGVIPRLFGSPGAKAVQDKLDYLADLGINAIWLAPINATVDYGYSVIDYFELRDGFGSKEDFRATVQAAHERGIRVLMDFVPNHTSSKHPYFLDTLEKGQDSPYWGFYDRDEKGDYTYYFDWTHLPNLNYDNPEVRRMMLEAFSYWVRDFDVDGFRVDACWGVQERRPDFWPEWRRELKRIKPDLLLLAEASARDSYNFDNGFDAAYDWTEQLGRWAWGSFWADDAPKIEPAQTVKLLKAALTNAPDGYHPDALIFRFLNNNDTRTRFIATHGEELTRVATALLLTLPGLPCIYTADELGQSFLPYDNGLISWRERYQGLRDYHRKLIALRKDIPSLHSRHWQLLETEPADQVLSYLRFLGGNREPVMVLLNFGQEPAETKISLPEEFSSLSGLAIWQDRLNNEEVATGTGKITIPGFGARILTAS